MPTAPVDGRAPYAPLAVHTMMPPPAADPSAPVPGADLPPAAPAGYVAPYVTESYVGGALADDPYGPYGAGYERPSVRTSVRRGAKSSSALIALLVVALIACVAVVVAKALLHKGGAPSAAPTASISLPPAGATPTGAAHAGLPSAIPGYVRYANAGTQHLLRQIRRCNGTPGDHAPKGTHIATYANVTGTHTRLVVEVFPESARRSFAGKHARNLSDGHLVRMVLSGSSYRTHAATAGPRGGVLRCGAGTFGNTAGSACVWSDRHDLGLVMSLNPQLPTAALAVVTNELRAQLP